MLLLNSPSLWVMPTASSMAPASCSVIRRVVATCLRPARASSSARSTSRLVPSVERATSVALTSSSVMAAAT
ncbi:hypothetical protein D3C74_451520 [compost metagenome]